jgi:hypothetical protein
MATWHRSRSADLGLRALGLALCGVAYLALSRLIATTQPAQPASAIALALAAIGFLGASAGGAMVVLGNHLFDEVEVSARWQRRVSSDDNAPQRWPGSNW